MRMAQCGSLRRFGWIENEDQKQSMAPVTTMSASSISHRAAARCVLAIKHHLNSYSARVPKRMRVLNWKFPRPALRFLLTKGCWGPSLSSFSQAKARTEMK